MNGMSYWQLFTLVAPETIVVITAVLVLSVDLLVMREEPVRNRFWIGAAFAGLGCLVAAVWLLAINPPIHLKPVSTSPWTVTPCISATRRTMSLVTRVLMT